ncbi:MAG TPA: flagellar filament capping protein FliD [Terriglobales bacterium]|nr:flagellar filament capping protein FliD [Terriglobales bacterium]
MGISFNAASLLNGNGIDVNSVVSDLQAAGQAQITTLQNQQTTLQTQATDLNSINSDLGSLASAVQALTDPLGAFSSLTANSSLPAVVTASATNSAAAGNYTVVVSGLASAGTVYSDSLANATTSILPSGASSAQLQLQIGGSSGTTQTIQITAGSNDTLTTLASYINQQSTANNWGVTATVLNDASGARLAITSNATGSTGALAITQNTTLDSNGNAAGTPTNLSFETPVGGTDATFTVNGIPFSSTSNTVNNAISGVTLNLVSSYSGEAQISVNTDTSSITSAVSSFVSAYNQVVTDLNGQFAYNSSTGSQGPLGSDIALENLQSSLLADASYAVSGNSAGYTSLASLGINMQNDGTLSIDSQTLANAIATNPSAVQNFFQSTTSGFATHFNTDLTSLTSPTSGPLNIDLTQNQAEQTDLSNQISDLQQQLATQKQNLVREFSAVNAALEEYPFLLQEVLTQLGTTSPTSSNTTPTSGTSASSTSNSGS